MCAQAAENTGQPGAGSDRHQSGALDGPDLVCGSRQGSGRGVAILEARREGIEAGRHLRDVHVVHVFDHHVGDEAQTDGITEHDTGIGHVDMHLHQGLIALDERAVAQRGDALADRGHIQG